MRLQFHFEEPILKILEITINRAIKLTFNLILFLLTQRTIKIFTH